MPTTWQMVTCNSLVWNAYSMANNKTPHMEMPTTWQIVSCNSLVWNAYKMAPLLSSFLLELRGSSAMSVSKLMCASCISPCWSQPYFLSFAFLSFEESSAMSIFTLMGRKPSSRSPLLQFMYLSWFSCKRSPWHYYGSYQSMCNFFIGWFEYWRNASW